MNAFHHCRPARSATRSRRIGWRSDTATWMGGYGSDSDVQTGVATRLAPIARSRRAGKVTI